MALTISYAGNIYGESQIRVRPNIYRVTSLLSDVLEYDTFNFTVKSSAIGEQRLWTALHEYILTANGEIYTIDDGDFADFAYGGEVQVYEDGVRKALFYVTNIVAAETRDEGDELFNVECVSLVGILAKKEHRGGIYDKETVGNIVADIMGSLPYTIDNNVAALQVSGWLPSVEDGRKNLAQVLFAVGASALKAADGGLHIAFITNDTAIPIPESRTERTSLYQKRERATKITLIEHEYFASSEPAEEVIYDNTSEAVGSANVIYFSKPYHSLRVSGLTILDSGANWAELSGVGVLYGVPYVHVARAHSQTISNDDETLEIAFNDKTLVSSLNYSQVMSRLVSYYSSAVIRRVTFHVEGEKPADLVQFYDRRGISRLGYIKTLDEQKTSFWRGVAEVVTDWTLQNIGNDFDATDEITTSGTYTVPSGVTHVRIVLIGGGKGGHGGEHAEDYTWTVFEEHGEPIGPGGAGGPEGTGGKILIVDLDVNGGDVISVTIGTGGAGGAEGLDGSDGTATTITVNGITYSSEDGAVFEYGYVNPISGAIYATRGIPGVAGADGGPGGIDNYGGSIVVGNVTYPGGRGANAERFTGDSHTANTNAPGGSGAAYKTPGVDASNVYGNRHAGAGVQPPDADGTTIRGGGGNGGHGGSGHGERLIVWDEGYSVNGGNGSRGSSGGDGIAVVLRKSV